MSLWRLVRGVVRPPRDPELRFQLLRRLGRRLVPEYRFKWPQMAWWSDAGFNAYLDRFGERGGLNDDRRWMLGQLLRLVDAVPGDTAECGAYRGAGSWLICSVNAARSNPLRRHFVFDSFAGLSAPSALDGVHWRRGDLACPADEVRGALAAFPGVSLHPGWIPERFADVADRRFAFVHIDVDLHEPTRDSLTFFYPRMSTGGIILCDDYGFTSCPGATRAVEEFLAERPEKMIALSCGGGFLIKGVGTAPRAVPPISGAAPAP